MRMIMTLFMIISGLLANDYSDFKKYYQENSYEAYKQACQIGKGIFEKNERDEKMLSLIGMACMKADYIDMLGLIQSRLYQSQQGRQNATLFASLLLQKRLISQFLHDNTELSTLALPVSTHPLSKAFIAIRDKNYETLSRNPLKLQFRDDSLVYQLYIDKEKKDKVAIDIIKSDGILEQHRYR
jgi:hypothetical protein